MMNKLPRHQLGSLVLINPLYLGTSTCANEVIPHFCSLGYLITDALHYAQLSLLKVFQTGTIASKMNVTPKGVYLPISKLHLILAVSNLLFQNNISQICYCGQISLQSAAVNCSLSYNLTPLGVIFILLAMVPILLNICRSCYY